MFVDGDEPGSSQLGEEQWRARYVEGRCGVDRRECCPDPSVLVAKECVGLAVVAFPSSSSFAGWLVWNPGVASQNAGSSRVVQSDRAAPTPRAHLSLHDSLKAYFTWKIHVEHVQRR